MKTSDIVRAWKDPEFRASQKNLPDSPAGMIELEDAALESVAGGLALEYSNTARSEGCTVSGEDYKSCGYICTFTTECGCS